MRGCAGGRNDWCRRLSIRPPTGRFGRADLRRDLSRGFMQRWRSNYAGRYREVRAVRSIRRNSRVLARVLLPLLAVAWLSAAAAPCAGMGLSSDADLPEPVSRDRSHLDHSGQQRASSPAHAHAAMHDHGNCPHCPPGGVSEHGASPSHAGCDEAEGTRDDRGNVLAKWDLKHSLPVPSRVSAEPSFLPPGLRRTRNQAALPSARVPLNIRYCIYLI